MAVHTVRAPPSGKQDYTRPITAEHCEHTVLNGDDWTLCSLLCSPLVVTKRQYIYKDYKNGFSNGGGAFTNCEKGQIYRC